MLSQVEISSENLLHNFNSFKNLLPQNTRIVSVIKANAYGHGQKEVAQLLEKYTDYFQVDDLQELIKLRQISQKPTFVLGFVSSEDLEQALNLNATLAIYDKAQIKTFALAGQKAGRLPQVHLTIDALLGRDGILPADLPGFLNELKKYQIALTGVYAHFSNLEDTADLSHGHQQVQSFQKALQILKDHGLENVQTHMSATAAILLQHQLSLDNPLVRLGVGLYGLWPSELLQRSFENDNFQLKPVLRWATKIAQVKELPANYPIGYGLTFITNRPTKIAVVPQGYSDGYDRKLSNCGEVLISGKRCRVLGRIAMNMFVVDVTNLHNVRAEDEVVLIGKQGREEITAAELAMFTDTINYEIVARISPLLPRVIK